MTICSQILAVCAGCFFGLCVILVFMRWHGSCKEALYGAIASGLAAGAFGIACASASAHFPPVPETERLVLACEAHENCNVAEVIREIKGMPQ